MISLNFVEPTDTDWIQWINDCNAETERLIRSHIEENPRDIIVSLYSLQKYRFYSYPFFGKCAYCESKVEENSPTYVEHFRPKGGICHLNNKTVKISRNGVQYPHPGYYWLAYNWRNLLPTCWQCNTWHKHKTGEKIGKGNRFPVSGQHAENPGGEVNENPELINPMLEDPQNHIFMDTLGIIHGLSDSSKANTTITLFGLNTREALVNGRKKEYENIRRRVKALLVLDDANAIGSELEGLKLIAQGSECFTIAAKKAISDVLSSHRIISTLLRSIL